MYSNILLARNTFTMLVLFLTISFSAFSQNQSFKLIDANTSKAISGVTYEYNEQNGLSDTLGLIHFTLDEKGSMNLSHIAYGEWTMNEEALKTAIETKVFEQAVLSVNLFPVTIIGMHDESMQEQTIELNYQDQMAHDGAAILVQIPTIAGIRKSGNYGIDPVMRGFKYDQLNIVMDGGLTAVAACPNRMDPPTSQMSPNMMGQIEILKGPHALRYGNAIGGTINFISTKPSFSNTNKLYGRLTGGYNSNGENIRSEGLIGYSGNKYDISLHGAFSNGTDYKDGDGNIVKSAYTRSSFGIDGAFKLTKRQLLTLSAAQNIAKDVDFPTLPMDLRNDNTLMLNVGHEISFSSSALKAWKTKLYGSFVDHFMDNAMKELDPRMVDAETAANTMSYGGRSEGKWNFNQGMLYAGADYRLEEADGTRTRSFLMGPNMGKTVYDNVWQESQISKTGLFAEYHITKASFQYIISGRMELNQAKSNDPDDAFASLYPEMESTLWNPGISLGVSKKLNVRNNVGLWLGRVNRSGNLTERYINYFPVGVDPYEMIGNPNIKSETNNQVDLTWSYKTKKTNISVDLFAAYLQNYISSVIDTTLKPKMPTSPGVRQYTNIDKALLTGFEFTWGQSLWAGLSHQLSMAYTYGQDLERNEALPEIAPLDIRYTLYGSYLDNKLKPEIVIRQVMEQNRISTEFGETPSPYFTLVDLKISYKAYKNLSLVGGMYNLFDQTYYEHLNRSVKGTNPAPINAPGRSFFISLNLNFM